ncbi:MAG: DUF1292 domain-containing protein [Roseburia sp.]|nr:DUF1292 domain-containing protein [Roseburia sp.]
MADFDFNDIEEMQVSLELEDGTQLECEVVYIFEWEGDDYAVLTPVDEKIEEIYFFGIEIEDNNGEPEITLLQIDDDDTLEALADVFDEILDNEELDRFGEPEEDEDEDEDDDDGRWDEFIKKKLED